MSSGPFLEVKLCSTDGKRTESIAGEQLFVPGSVGLGEHQPGQTRTSKMWTAWR